MKAISTAVASLNIREAPTTNARIVGKLNKGDFVYGAIKGGWIGFQRVYRFNGTRENIAGYASTGYMMEVDEPEPELRAVKHVVVVFENGDMSVDDTRLVDAVKAAL